METKQNTMQNQPGPVVGAHVLEVISYAETVWEVWAKTLQTVDLFGEVSSFLLSADDAF